MAAFESFEKFESYFDEILDLVEEMSVQSIISPKIMEAVEAAGNSESSHQSTSINVSMSSPDPPPQLCDNESKVQVVIFYFPYFHYLKYAIVFFVFLKFTFNLMIELWNRPLTVLFCEAGRVNQIINYRVKSLPRICTLIVNKIFAN